MVKDNNMYESQFYKEIQILVEKKLKTRDPSSERKRKYPGFEKIENQFGAHVIGALDRKGEKILKLENGFVIRIDPKTKKLHSENYPAVQERDKKSVQFYLNGENMSQDEWEEKTGKEWMHSKTWKEKTQSAKKKIKALRSNKPKDFSKKPGRYTPPPKKVKK